MNLLQIWILQLNSLFLKILRNISLMKLLIVTHRMAPLSLVQRIVVLDAGRVNVDGPKENTRALEGRCLMAYLRNSILLFIIVVFTVFAIWWSNSVQLDEFSRMQGKNYTFYKREVIQSEFSGRLISLNVIVGQYVLEGDVLAKVRMKSCYRSEIKNEEVEELCAALIRTAGCKKKSCQNLMMNGCLIGNR